MTYSETMAQWWREANAREQANPRLSSESKQWVAEVSARWEAWILTDSAKREPNLIPTGPK